LIEEMMKTYRLYISEMSIKRGAPDRAIWRRNVLADSYREALIKCLPEIKKKVLPLITDETIKKVAVYVGRKGIPSEFAGRLEPIRITREGTIHG
jgi:hypothetical protein